MVELVEGADAVDLKVVATPDQESVELISPIQAVAKESEPLVMSESVGEPIPAVAAPSSASGSGYSEFRRNDVGNSPSRPNDQPASTQLTVVPPPVVEATESQADGVAKVAEILKAATTARWPMYLRNVKQLLRAADGGFDERRYGFAGLVELVRGCQKEGLVRLERDRRGGLRVFPGPSLQRAAPSRQETQETTESQIDARAHAQAQLPDHPRKSGHEIDRGFQPRPFTSAIAQPVDAPESVDADVLDTEPMPTVDPTAELLGTASRRRRPARTTPLASARSGNAAPAKKPAAKKAAAPRRSAKSKTAADSKS
jgi:hypothetical protein